MAGMIHGSSRSVDAPPLPMTDRVVNFVNYVAARVAEKYPDRLIEMYGYSSTGRQPPVRERVHPNVLVKHCFWPLCQNHEIFDKACPRNHEFVKRTRGWTARGLKHHGIYHYGDYQYVETPACWYDYTVRMFRAMHTLGARYVLGETENTMSGSALWYYLISRTLWDVDTDSEAVIDEFCSHFYGPAAAPMAEYYRTLERAHREHAAQVGEQPGEESETINNLERWTPQIIRLARTQLDRASQAAGDDQLLQARIDRAWFSLLFTQAITISRVGPKTEEAFAEGQAAFDRAKEIQVARDIRSNNWGRHLLRSFWVPPLAAQAAEPLMRMPLVWKFRLDPDDAGEEGDWMNAQPDANWIDIRTNASWTDQGHAYHGTAWYTTRITTPEFPPDRTIWLLFGAIDGNCQVWIDGRLTGTRNDPSGMLWDKPYALDVTDFVRSGAMHRVTVKVNKDRFAAGVWKPARLKLGKKTGR